MPLPPLLSHNTPPLTHAITHTTTSLASVTYYKLLATERRDSGEHRHRSHVLLAFSARTDTQPALLYRAPLPGTFHTRLCNGPLKSVRKKDTDEAFTRGEQVPKAVCFPSLTLGT